MKRTTCSACRCEDLEQFLDLGSSPIADAYTETADEVSPTYPLQVAVCPKCRLVQLLEVVDHGTLFGTGYSFYSSASAPLSAYHREYAADVMRQYRRQALMGVVEVGCNDGDLLRHFRSACCPTLGVDPAVGPARVAVEDRHLNVLVTPFSLDEAKLIRFEFGPAGLVIANHVLAHVADVADCLAGIAHLLRDDGLAMVEVQYLPDMLTNNAFDLVYHEHRNFFSLTSLEQAALRWGLHVVEAKLTDRQGGSLRVTLKKKPGGWNDTLRASERWLNSFGAYEGLQGRVERIRSRLIDLLSAEADAGRVVAGYGAPAKATTLLNYCGIKADRLTHVTDTTVAKQGRYIPGTGVQILDPNEAPLPDTYLVLAWNYFATILRSTTEFSGRWMVPIPAPSLI